jgi:hypothetical protein
LVGVACLVVVVAALDTGSAGAAVRPAAAAIKRCRAPHLTGLTLDLARRRAARAGCRLRLEGAPLRRSEVQTIARQSPTAGRRSSTVAVWLNPLCGGSAAYGPGITEPMVTPGPTELVSGFYLAGGPFRPFSAPGCKRPEPPPGAGTVEVIDAAGEVVATQTSTAGHFVEIPLPAGSYTIRATFLNATINEVHPTTTGSVVIPAGHTVRQDFFLSIP